TKTTGQRLVWRADLLAAVFEPGDLRALQPTRCPSVEAARASLRSQQGTRLCRAILARSSAQLLDRWRRSSRRGSSRDLLLGRRLGDFGQRLFEPEARASIGAF